MVTFAKPSKTHLLMASGIITTTKLDPFYQKFLKSHFDCSEIVFTFPKNHDLHLGLNLLLSTNPHDGAYPDYGKHTFRIDLYHIRTRDIRQYNYLSEKASAMFASKVRDFYSMIYHEFYSSLYRSYNHKDIVYLWMECHNFTESAYDRIEREARRYRKRNYDRNYIEKKKLNKVKTAPTSLAHLSNVTN